MAMSRKSLLAIAFIMILVLSMLVGAQFFKEALANPIPPYKPPKITVLSPLSGENFQGSYINWKIKVQVYGYTYHGVEMIKTLNYTLDSLPPVSISIKYPGGGYGYNYSATGSGTLNLRNLSLSSGWHLLTFEGESDWGTLFNASVIFTTNYVKPQVLVESLTTKPGNPNITVLNCSLDIPSWAIFWMGYSLDGKDNVTLSKNTALNDLAIGMHNVTVYARDILGNRYASDALTFNVVALSPSPTQQPTLEPTQSAQPTAPPNGTDPYLIIGIVAVGIAAVIIVGLTVYSKKHGKKKTTNSLAA
jgi:hypothetical protein